ncbi:hypothetical protein BpV2_007c [Bathycoccus sp. RCC1105 virus BpV2]|nr:hypothetical protein BpV2_007c [Bathycoccus sp. RCC1105 virus BpV2]
MNTALRITPFTPKLGRTTRIKRTSKKDDTFLDTHDDKPVYVTLEDLETSDDRMKRFSSAWMNKYATRNGSPTLETFANPESVEMINGRVAQVGWMMALYYEIIKNETVWEQVFKTRTFTLIDGTVDTVTYPTPGFFVLQIVAGLIVTGSLFSKLKLVDKDAEFGPFTKRAELINGRGAMVGLLALSIVEHLNGGIALF